MCLLALAAVVASYAVAGCEGTDAEPRAEAPRGALRAGLSADCTRDLEGARDARTFATLATRCLGEIDGWADAVLPIEDRFSEAAATAADIAPPPIVCSPPDEWQAVEHDELGDAGDLILAGFVHAGDPTITLAPPTCLALERLLADPGLACLVEEETVCPFGSVEAAFALATLAHEAQHVAGIADEATAECYALQHVDEVARAIGMPADQAAAIAPFVDHAEITPPSYTSPECRPGGALDLEPQTPAFP
jgi:hypothetical protein